MHPERQANGQKLLMESLHDAPIQRPKAFQVFQDVSCRLHATESAHEDCSVRAAASSGDSLDVAPISHENSFELL